MNGSAFNSDVFYWTDRFFLIVLGWLAGLAFLAVTGLLLSRATLDSVSSFKANGSSRMGFKGFLIRDLYRLVIAVSSVYFYFSLPIVVITLVAVSIAVAYGWLQLLNSDALSGTRLRLGAILIPFGLSLLLFYSAVMMVTGFATSVILPGFSRRKGRVLKRDEAPALWQLLDEVAARVGTRKVNKVYVRPEVTISVNEEGFFLFRLLGLGRRCLYLGLGALPGMTQGELRAILAHEYGHFAHRDTIGGGMAMQSLTSMEEMVFSLKAQGLAQWSNPAWLFVSGYTFLYWGIVHGASRMQEILADRRAVLSYGAPEFIDALNRIHIQHLRFDTQIRHEMFNALNERRQMTNVYDLPPLEEKYEKGIRIQMDRDAKNPTDFFDTHPVLAERIALIEGMSAESSVEPNPNPAWNLIPAAQLQDEMTGYWNRRLKDKVAELQG